MTSPALTTAHASTRVETTIALSGEDSSWSLVPSTVFQFTSKSDPNQVSVGLVSISHLMRLDVRAELDTPFLRTLSHSLTVPLYDSAI